jgi:RHS repeat-associated protein
MRSATGTKGTITYLYDAAGNKLKKRTVDSAGNIQTAIAYIGSFQYQGKRALGGGNPADTLLFFGQEEGRVRVISDNSGRQAKTAFKYDYFVKDHLGNTRMVLTEEQQTDRYPAATMEVADSAVENLFYSKLAEKRVNLPAGYPSDTTTNPNNKVARLNGSPGQPKLGPGITLKVMAGDQFSIRASSWYRLNGSAPGTPANPLPDLLAALISGVGALPGGGHPSPAMLQANSTPLSDNISHFLQDTGASINSTRPHAFVNWVLFDDQFNYIAESSGFEQVGSDQEFKKHVRLNLPVAKSGYLYIYLNNETPNVDVFFDNLQVTHARGALLEENHYYPYGLTMAGISDKALKTNYAGNMIKFQKQELQNKEFSDGSGLEMYEFKYRFDDPQIGRFWSIDPLADKYAYNSTYAFSENKVISHVELEGLEAVLIVEQGNYLKANVGHTFVSVGSGKEQTVYTYGRWAGTNENSSGSHTPLNSGPGVMIKLTGDQARAEIAKYVNKEGAQAFEIKNADEKKVAASLESEFSKSNVTPDAGKYKGDERAHVIDGYDITCNNCTTKSLDAVKAGLDGKGIEFTETKVSQGGVVYSVNGTTSGTISPMVLGYQLNSAKNDSKAKVVEITNQYKGKKP